MQAKFAGTIALIMIAGICGCGGFPMKKASEEKIISARTGQTISFETMISELSEVSVVYVGEHHTNPAHHAAQLSVIRAMAQHFSDIVVGMEMFAVPYQPLLNEWFSGNTDEASFLRKTHWYANWRFDYGLYRDILNFIREYHIHLAALNIPFHIPPKISVGGLDSLSEEDKKYLPETIGLYDPEHRAYVSEIFKHHSIPGRDRFDDFYAAQCVWEDAMAESVAKNLKNKMIVLAGNGHIFRKFGIPDRAFQRNRASFRTVYMVSDDKNTDFSAGDYLWVISDANRK
jgi:uncharacterized iron-regulated protein